MSNRFPVPLTLILVLPLLSGVATPSPNDPPQAHLQLATATDQIHNESGGATTVEYSVVESGLSTGTTGSSGVVHADPAFVDADGPDDLEGSRDDDYRPIDGSPAVDAGDDSGLMEDRFDLDDDGDTSEPVPIDRSGHRRVIGASADLGAYEFDDGSVATEPAPEVVDESPLLDIYPVPATDELRIRVGVASTATIAIHDLLGRRLRTVHDGPIGPAGTELRVATDDFASGVYLVVLRTEDGSRAQSVVIVDE